MIGKKIFATIAAFVIIAAAFVVIENVTDMNILNEKASAGHVTPGVTHWEGNSTNTLWTVDVLNNTEAEKQDIYYGNTMELDFNGNVLSTGTTYYLYKPAYRANGNGTFFIDYRYVTSISGGGSKTVEFATPGLWIILPFQDDPLGQFNMSNMSAEKETTSVWYDISAWFWVNSSTSYTVELSDTTVYYDHNNSITVEIKDSTGSLVTGTWFVDIWNVYNIDSGTGIGMERLARHQKVTDGTWTITGANMYAYTHSTSYGAGTYQVRAYKDESYTSETDYMYGDSSGYTTNGNYGWNETFGNLTHWATKFVASGTQTNILTPKGGFVYSDIYNTPSYKYETCGAFAPPELLTDPVNFTVEAGKGDTSHDLVTITDNATIFWNDSYDKRVQIKVSTYDGTPLDVTGSGWTVELYNRSQKPSTTTAKTAIPAGCYNISYSDDGSTLNITAAWNGTWNNRWGWNSSIGNWAPKGRVYLLIRGNTLGNSSEEWNNTPTINNAYFTLTSASNRFVWVNDGEAPISDGELGTIPAIGSVPVDIQFQIQGSDYNYYGDTSNSGSSKSVKECAENITIAGDSLFTGTLDKYINYADSWFSTDTWTVPIIPLMDVGGGTITITANAWNSTIQGELSIGGTGYIGNGTIVTITPNRFNIDEQNQTLEVTVQSASGQDLPGATVTLYYIDESLWDAGAGPMDGAGQLVDTLPGTWGLSETSFHFNTTQQTTNQTATSGLSESHAPRNLTVYANSNSMYGYALVKMDPNNDLETEISQNTFVAGYPYEEVTINCTFAGNSTDTPSTASADKNNFEFYIYDEEHNDVTDTIFAGAGYTSTDLDNEYSITLNDVYAISPGTYYIYGKNLTHDSTDYNASFVVEAIDVSTQVEGTPEGESAAFIWNHDENVSASFTVTYNGVAQTGTLRIDNISATGDGSWNKTFKNTSFYSSDGQSGTDQDPTNVSLEVDSSDLVDGTVTIHDITASHLPSNTAMENVSFWFRPLNEDTSAEGGWARCNGRVPVQVPTVTPSPMYVPLGTQTTVTLTATGRGTALDGVYVGLNGRGLSVADFNSTTGADGTAQFKINPSSSGDIDIHVGEEGRVITTKITVTNKALEIDAPIKVNEGSTFTVTVYESGSTDTVEGASVTLQGETTPQTTDANGQVTFTAPEVSSDLAYTITATYTAEGYTSDTASVTVINVPKLTVSVSPTSVCPDETLTITVSKDDATPAVNAKIYLDDATEPTTYTDGTGKATITVSDPGEHTVKAEFGSFQDDTATFTVKSAEDETCKESPGFELLTLVIALGVAFILLRRRKK